MGECREEERGSSPVEFVLVGSLLTALLLAVIQLALAVYVRNVVHDAAVEGAHYGALADTTLDEAADRTRQNITRAVGASYAEHITVASGVRAGHPVVEVRVTTTVPVVGLLGVPLAWEVHADAPRESLGP